MSFLQFAGGLARGASQEIDERDQRSKLIADRAVQRYLNKYDEWEKNYNTDVREYKKADSQLKDNASFLSDEQREMVLAAGPDGVTKFLAALKSDVDKQQNKYLALPKTVGKPGYIEKRPDFEYTDEMREAFVNKTFTRTNEYLEAKKNGNLDTQMYLAKDLDTQAKLYAQDLNPFTPLDRDIDVMTKTMEEQAGGIGTPVQFIQSQVRTQLANLGVTNPEIIEGTLGGGLGYNAPIYEIMTTKEMLQNKIDFLNVVSAETDIEIKKEDFKWMQKLKPLEFNLLNQQIKNAKTTDEINQLRKQSEAIELEFTRITKSKEQAKFANQLQELNRNIAQQQFDINKAQEKRALAEFDATKIDRIYNTALATTAALTMEIEQLATSSNPNMEAIKEKRLQLDEARSIIKNVTMTKLFVDNYGKNSIEKETVLNDYLNAQVEEKLQESFHNTAVSEVTDMDAPGLPVTTKTDNPFFMVRDANGETRNVYKNNQDTQQEYQEIMNNVVSEVEYEFLTRFANISEDGKTVEIKEEHQFNTALVKRVQQLADKFIGEGDVTDLNEFKDSLITSKIDDLGPIVKQMIFNNENKTEIIEELDTFTNNHSDSIRVYDILKIDVEREREKGQFGPSEIIPEIEAVVDEDGRPIVGFETEAERTKREENEKFAGIHKEATEKAEVNLKNKNIKPYLNFLIEDMLFTGKEMNKQDISREIQTKAGVSNEVANKAMVEWMKESSEKGKEFNYRGEKFEFFAGSEGFNLGPAGVWLKNDTIKMVRIPEQQFGIGMK